MNTTTAPIAAKIKNVGSKKKKIAKMPPKNQQRHQNTASATKTMNTDLWTAVILS